MSYLHLYIVCMYVCMYVCTYIRVWLSMFILSYMYSITSMYMYVRRYKGAPTSTWVLTLHCVVHCKIVMHYITRCCMSVCPYMPCPSACVSVSGGWYHPSRGVSLSLCVSVSDSMGGLLSTAPLLMVVRKWRRCSWTKEPTWRLRTR